MDGDGKGELRRSGYAAARALGLRAVHMLMGREMVEEQQKQYAEEKGVELVYVPIGLEGFVLASTSNI